MNNDYPAAAAVSADTRSSWRRTLIIAALAFLAGLGAMAWTFGHVEPARRLLVDPPAADGDGATLPGAAVDPAPVLSVPSDESVAQVDAALSARVRELENRLAEINVAADAASTNAGRAEGLLIAFAARRALDRGMALGYIEGQLRERFAESQPRAVASIIRAARQPVTLEQLETGLEALGPDLLHGQPDEDWWAGLREELGRLFIVRRAGTPSPEPGERLRRAMRQLEGGQVEAALAEVSRLPGRERAAAWSAEARRYIEARQALDIIETAAILAPGQPPAAAN